MQLMPTTARYVARIAGQPRPTNSALHDPHLNIRLGQAYIRYVLKAVKPQDNLLLAIAAYNAEPGNAARWSANTSVQQDPLLFLEMMGSAETRTFARDVLSALWIYRDRLGQPVLPDGLSLIEDPHRPRVGASRPFDAEGLPTRCRNIVENGVLTGWTLDLANGRKLGMPSTANAARGVAGPPSPSAWNISLTQGTQSRQDLIRDMGTGLLVTSLIGSTINPNTGDYSRGASGFWVENGEIAFPVHEVTIAGNLKDLFGRLELVGNDVYPYSSTLSPSLVFGGVDFSGA